MLKNIEVVYFNDFGKINKINDFKIKQLIIIYIIDNCNYFNNIEINNEKNLNFIKSNNYKLINIKNNNNYILLFKKINNIFYNILIEKNFNLDEKNLDNINFNKINMYFINNKIPKDYYNGTIIDGIISEDKTTFNMYDIYNFKGNQIDENLNNKINYFNKIRSDIELELLRLDIIEYQDLNKLKECKNLSGILFIPFESNMKKFIIYFEQKLTKIYKKLIMKKINTDVFNLYEISNSENKISIGIAHIPTLELSRYFADYEDEIKVNCYWYEKFRKWVPFEII